MNRRTFLAFTALLSLLVSQRGLANRPASPVRLAIWPLDSFAMGGTLAEGDVQIVRDIIPDMLTSALAANGQVELVEREKLLEILNEQKLGASDLADEETRLRLGRMLGARYMLFGNYLKLGPLWQLDMRLVDSESSRIMATASVNQEQGELLNAVEQLVRDFAPFFTQP